MGRGEKPSSTPECIDSTLTKEALGTLQKEINTHIAMLENAGVDVLRLGERRVPVVSYADLKETSDDITPDQYFDFLCSVIDTPDDVFAIINKPFMEWKEFQDAYDRLLPASTVLANGGGDCDNLSWVAKCLLDILSCKKGYDYKARVIAIPAAHHALCIYNDRDGKMCGLDQTNHTKGFTSIYDASSFFANKTEESPEEVVLYKNKMRLMIRLDPTTLENTYASMTVRTYEDYRDAFLTPDLFLPPDWKKYQQIQLHFNDQARLVFSDGIITEKTASTGIIDFYDSQGHLEQRQFPDQGVESYNAEGTLVEKKFPDGTVFFYDPVTRVVYQKNMSDGTHETFDHTTGALFSRDFLPHNPIEAEFYNAQGVVIQRDFRHAEQSPYKRIWYTDEGKIKATENWSGKRTYVD